MEGTEGHKRRFFKGKKKKIVKRLIFLLFILVLLGLSFAAGWHYGGIHQHNKDKTALASTTAATGFLRHRALVGTVTKISSTQIVINIETNQSATAGINKSTVIRNTQEQTVGVSGIKVGSRVIVTTTVNSDQTLLAQRILLIK